ncbi:MAG: response regulator transcription factor [Bacteroidales bacterium]
MKKNILVVDDEEDLCEILRYNLEQAGFKVASANSAEEALTMNIASFDLLILDVMMGEMSGFKMASILKKSKNTAHIPIIFCTAKSAENDTIEGLEIGADDYVCKPFSVREVVARVNAVLRRTAAIPEPITKKEIIKHQGIMLDTIKKKATFDQIETVLTKTEFEILKLFLENPNKVFSREDLLKKVWPDEVFVSDRTVDVHITRLRKKMGVYDKIIVTRPGYGYCFEY